MIHPNEAMFQERQPEGLGGRFYGVYPAIVKDNQDPDGQGKVKICLPGFPDPKSADCQMWARMSTFMAGSNRGSWFLPDVDDEVLVSFQAGDVSKPFVLGMLWNGQDKPPQTMASGNDLKVLRSRNGLKITLDDADGKERMKLETPGGVSLELKDGPGGVEIIDSNGNSVKLSSSGVSVQSSGKVDVSASTVSVSAGSVTIDAGTTRVSGVLQTDTLIATTVIASTYTPGAGNIW